MTTIDVSPEGLYLPTDIAPEQLFKAMGKLRRAAMDEIERLIAFLDSTEPDTDLEPDLAGYSAGMDSREGDESDDEDGADSEPALGWTGASCYPENQSQDGPNFCLNADAGRDLEDEHDGSEPDVDGEASLGWTDNPNQGSAAWQANHLGTVDLEQGVGAVRKPRPKSKTGGKVLRGCAVLV
jgi:hypothetical protein